MIGGGIGVEGTIAWWSHIGGFVAGLVLVGLFVPRRRV
jgi:membrane associated rhomboid family serine protease